MNGFICKVRVDYDDGLFGDTYDSDLTGVIHITEAEAVAELNKYRDLPHLAGYYMFIEEVTA